MSRIISSSDNSRLNSFNTNFILVGLKNGVCLFGNIHLFRSLSKQFKVNSAKKPGVAGAAIEHPLEGGA
jgi:hypothetical protein